MTGKVDALRRAIISVSIAADSRSTPEPLDVWIDTGFNGDLVILRALIAKLALPLVTTADAVLADGSQVVVSTCGCVIDWFGENRRVEVVANKGSCPLLEAGLLLGHELFISYKTGEIRIDGWSADHCSPSAGAAASRPPTPTSDSASE